MSQTDRLYEQLSHSIRTAQIKPGELLAEPEIAARYGVSRTPARETLRLLAAEGWLQVMPRKGYLVRPLQLQDVSEVMALRLMIEPSLAARAAARATPELCAGLRDMVNAQHESAAGQADQLERAQNFHIAVAEASGNQRAASVLGPLVDEISRLHHILPQAAAHVASTAERDGHLKIVEALEAADCAAAERAMREHLEESRSAMFSGF